MFIDFFCEFPFQAFYPIVYQIVYLFLIDLYKFFMYFGYESYTNLSFHSVACLSNLLVV